MDIGAQKVSRAKRRMLIWNTWIFTRLSWTTTWGCFHQVFEIRRQGKKQGAMSFQRSILKQGDWTTPPPSPSSPWSWTPPSPTSCSNASGWFRCEDLLRPWSSAQPPPGTSIHYIQPVLNKLITSAQRRAARGISLKVLNKIFSTARWLTNLLLSSPR